MKKVCVTKLIAAACLEKKKEGAQRDIPYSLLRSFCFFSLILLFVYTLLFHMIIFLILIYKLHGFRSAKPNETRREKKLELHGFIVCVLSNIGLIKISGTVQAIRFYISINLFILVAFVLPYCTNELRWTRIILGVYSSILYGYTTFGMCVCIYLLLVWV